MCCCVHSSSPCFPPVHYQNTLVCQRDLHLPLTASPKKTCSNASTTVILLNAQTTIDTRLAPAACASYHCSSLTLRKWNESTSGAFCCGAWRTRCDWYRLFAGLPLHSQEIPSLEVMLRTLWPHICELQRGCSLRPQWAGLIDRHSSGQYPLYPYTIEYYSKGSTGIDFSGLIWIQIISR